MPRKPQKRRGQSKNQPIKSNHTPYGCQRAGKRAKARNDECWILNQNIHHSKSKIAQIPRVPAPQAGLTSGDQSVVEPPGPIPNPEVKRHSANGSGTTGPVRVGRRQVYARYFAKQSKVPGSFLSRMLTGSQALDWWRDYK